MSFRHSLGIHLVLSTLAARPKWQNGVEIASAFRETDAQLREGDPLLENHTPASDFALDSFLKWTSSLLGISAEDGGQNRTGNRHSFCAAAVECNSGLSHPTSLVESRPVLVKNRRGIHQASMLKEIEDGSSASGPYGMKLSCDKHVGWVSLPVRKEEVTRFLQDCDSSTASSSEHVGFVIPGEEAYGMPPLPIETLNRYSNRACSGHKSEADTLPPLPVTPVILPFRSSSELARIRAGEDVPLQELGLQILTALKSRGWARIVVDDHAAQWRIDAHNALKELHQMDAFRKYTTSGYVGFDQVTGRDMMQMRSGFEDLESLDWPQEVQKFHRPLVKAFTATQDVAHRIFASILPHIGLEACRACSEDLLFGRNGARFGPSVMVGYVYKDYVPELESGGTAGKDDFGLLKDATGIHADSGILTVASAASSPGLEMWNPWTGTLDRPEVGLPPNEWIVFAGETLGFLTGGEIRAAAHRVPWLKGTRVSMPYFLRTNSRAMLGAPGGKDVMSAGELSSDHLDNIVRPWRTPGSEN